MGGQGYAVNDGLIGLLVERLRLDHRLGAVVVRL